MRNSEQISSQDTKPDPAIYQLQAVDEFRRPWRICSGTKRPSTSYVTATGVREHQPGLRRHFRALVGAPPRVAGTGYPLPLATTAAPDAQFMLSVTPRVGRGGDHLGM